MKMILMGNAGSGKSTMARRLLAESGGEEAVGRLSLDEIAWEDGPKRLPLAESRRRLDAFLAEHEHWIIEGCYGDLIALALPHCEELRFLNPGVETCLAHCRQRPWEPEKFATPEDQQAMLENLLAWVSEYESRDDEYGLTRHRALFDGFPSHKLDGFRLHKREFRDVSEYEL